MKVLNILLKIVAGLLVLVVLAVVLVPIIFKDDIQSTIDAELDNSLNATVFYDVDEFGISLFRSFPNLSVQMSDFGIKGIGVFETDTLAAVDNFEFTVDLSSVFGDIKVNKIRLDNPKIAVIVLADGSANYDIAKASEQEEEVSDEASSVSVQIDRWEINNAQVVYYDQSMDFYMTINGLTHTGSGDFSNDVFEMVTNTVAEAVSLGYDGTEYVIGKTLNADVTMNMDMREMTFTFAENSVVVNDFGFGFDGSIAMPEDDITMDITFAGSDIDLRSILSLIPGVYEEYLEGISASGDISFDGFVKGIYNDESMPRVFTNLKIAEGKVSTPDMLAPLEKIATTFTFDYPTADLSDTEILLDFKAQLAGQKTALELAFKNLDNYQWDVKFDADMDLEKMAGILPLEDTELRGKMIARLTTKGQMSDVEAEQWDALPTTGLFKANGFYFKSPDLPQGFGMENVDASFDPKKIDLKSFKANAGKTDLNLRGRLENYLAFALGKDEKLVGNLDFTSKLIDANEWMSEKEEESDDTQALEVVRIPTNIDFTLSSNIDKIEYTNLTLSHFGGKVLVKDGAIILDHNGFKLLNGQFVMTGEYDRKPKQPVFAFEFDIERLSIPEAFSSFSSIQKLVPIAKKATGNLSTNFKANGALGSDMMPVISTLEGSGLIEISEAAVKDINVLDGIMKIANIKGGNSKNIAKLKDVMMEAEIKDGRLHVKPFDLTIGGNEAVVSGSTGLDGSVDYVMGMKVPSGKAGQAVSQALSKFLGDNAIPEFINLNLGVTGDYNDPNVKLLGAKPATASGGVRNGIKAQAKEQTQQKIDQGKTEVKEQVTEAVEEGKKVIEEKKEEAKKELEIKAKDAMKNLFKKKKN